MLLLTQNSVAIFSSESHFEFQSLFLGFQVNMLMKHFNKYISNSLQFHNKYENLTMLIGLLLLLVSMPPVTPNDETPEIYGFLDLFKPEKELVETLWFSNPVFLGPECGPGAYVALDKVHEAYKAKDNKYGTQLKLLTYKNLTKSKWDKTSGNPKSDYPECGDEWKTGRCFKRLEESNIHPTLILGSHKDMSAQTAALHALINHVMYATTTMPLSNNAENSPVGREKKDKGYSNTLGLFPINRERLGITDFLDHYNWKESLTIINQPFVSNYIATGVFDYYRLKDSEMYLLNQIYPISYMDEKNGFRDIDPEFGDVSLEKYWNFTKEKFVEPQHIKDRSRSKSVGLCEISWLVTSTLNFNLSVVLLFGSQRMVRDMMLQAHAAGRKHIMLL